MAILVVDDSRAMRMIVTRELRKAGYENVVEAENGAVALQTISGGGVDLVLSDWNMPDMNGIDLLTNLRAGGNTVPFGFVTSETAGDVRARAFEVGASFIITKPFTSDDLDREINLALGSDGAGLAGTGGPAPRTIDVVLTGLLGRDVTVSAGTGPDRAMGRGLAQYEMGSSARAAFAVMEMPLAAGLACALARIPGREAEEWGKAHAFNDAMEANFFEVANVLGAFASNTSERCVLKSVRALGEGELPAELKDEAAWHSKTKVQIDGYPSGQLGFVVP